MADGHERLPRSAGGSITDPANVVGCCRLCHDHIHQHPAEAKRLGFTKSRYAMDDNANKPDTGPTSQPASADRAARVERMKVEYPQAVTLAERYGMKLLGVERMGRYDLDVDSATALTLMAATGQVDANDLTPAQSDELIRLACPPRRPGERPHVDSLILFVEAVIAVLRVAPVAPGTQQAASPQHVMPAAAGR